MFKQSLFVASLIISISMSMAVGVSRSFASTAAMNIAITGVVQFQERSTMAPDVECQKRGVPCERSKPYWSLVIQSEDTQYLINKPFNVGGIRAPESVQIAGLALRPGSIIKMEGLAVPERENFFVLTEVRTVDLVMYSEWTCNSLQKTDPQLIAHVGYEPNGDQGGNYQMHVEEVEDHATYSIAQIDRAFFKELIHRPSNDSSSYEWIFGGRNSGVDVMLDISQQFGRFEGVPAMLKVARNGLRSRDGSPIVSEIQMICSQ